jgi:hypothetical protein
VIRDIVFPTRASHMHTLMPCAQCGALKWTYVSSDHWKRNILTCDECNAEYRCEDLGYVMVGGT